MYCINLQIFEPNEIQFIFWDKKNYAKGAKNVQQ